MLKLLCIFIGGGLGSICRYSVGVYLIQSSQGRLPWATFIANALGCLLIGLLMGYFERTHTSWLYMLLVTGFCGGFTTFSTFSNESFQLMRQGLYTTAFGYMALSLFIGLSAVGVGLYAVKTMPFARL